MIVLILDLTVFPDMKGHAFNKYTMKKRDQECMINMTL